MLEIGVCRYRGNDGVILILRVIDVRLLMSLQALAAASDNGSLRIGGGPENTLDRPKASIDRTITPRFLVANAPRDNQAIADKLVEKADRIAERRERKFGPDSVERYALMVPVGDLMVEVEPMKVAGE